MKTHKLSIDDYIIGAMFIYIDIIYLFAHMVLIIIACFRWKNMNETHKL